MKHIAIAALAAALLSLPDRAPAGDSGHPDRAQQPADTEVWGPEPPVITAAKDAAPSDATLLLGGDLSHWESLTGGAVAWPLENGVLTVAPGSGDIKTKQGFCDLQLHLEWKVPLPEKNMNSQERNNSGIFLQQRYEVQILDSYNNKTYVNGQAASVYKQYIPLVNAARRPGEWQEYDIIFKAPTFDGDRLRTPGYITLLHNGVLVQNHVALQGTTENVGLPAYRAHGCAPLQLQDHTNKVSFRNIWVRPL